MLCSNCQAIFHDIPFTTSSGRGDGNSFHAGIHHLTASSFLSALDQACYICMTWYNYLWEEAREDLSFFETKKGFTKFDLCYDPSTERRLLLQIKLCWLKHKIKLEAPLDEWELLAGDDESWNFILQDRSEREIDELRHKSQTIHASTDSPITFAQICKWKELCVGSHHLCNHNPSDVSNQHRYPTRLIDVGTTVNPILRLIETAEHRLVGDYATLSHCWGKIPIKTLLSSNIRDFKNEIDTDYLSNTFRQAVSTARELRLQYIWIDSLCIIQDSAEDWTREAALMADVYNYAVCNIAATKSENSLGGLFVAGRNAEYLQEPCVVRFRMPTLEDFLSVLDSEDLVGKGKVKDFVIIDPNYWNRRVEASPIAQRGWIAQERILAKRVVHFCFDEVLWECQELRASERYPAGIPLDSKTPSVFKDSVPRRLKRNQDASSHHSKPLDLSPILEAWKGLLNNYTKLSLTKQSDKLIAIAGVARRFAPLLVSPSTTSEQDSPYVAGLWRTNLLNELLWKISNNTSSARPSEYRAPSWSWASVDGQVVEISPLSARSDSTTGAASENSLELNEVLTDMPEHTAPLASILSVYTATVTRDPFGQVSSGCIRLRGFLYPARLYMYAHSSRVTCQYRAEEVLLDVAEVPSASYTKQVILLPLMERRFSVTDEFGVEERKYRMGLILTPEADRGQKKGWYRRIGSFMGNSKLSKLSIIDFWMPWSMEVHDRSLYEDGFENECVFNIV